MSQTQAALRFGPYAFELTQEEARIAAARAGLRLALGGRLTRGHVAPLAAFTLATMFIAILTLTGLLARRHGEIALLLAIGAFMIQRLTTRRRFMTMRRDGLAQIEAMRTAGPFVARLEETGLTLEGAAAPMRWIYAQCPEIEDAGGILYLWPASGPPAILPTRIFADPQEAARVLAFMRDRRLRKLAALPHDQ